jgi:hypothetical protein
MTILAESRTKTNRKSGKASAAPKMTVSLCLAIDHQAYTVTPIRAEDPDITRAWRLEKKGADRAVYDVATTRHGHQCDCPDFEVRRNGIDAEGCKHIRAAVVAGLLDGAPIIPATHAVEPTPSPVEPKVSDRCYHCTRLAFLPKLDANGRTNCYECREEMCDICERTGTRRVTRADGLVICDPCSKRKDEEAELKAFLSAPAPVPCCPPDEPSACQPCQATATATDAATAILDRGLELAEAEAVNQPASIVDTYDDEVPEHDFEPTDADRLAVAEWVTAADIQSHLDRSATLPLTEALDHIGNVFRAWDNPFGSMLAWVLEELAQKASMTGATTPHELLTGIESLDREARETWERVGYERGRQSVAAPLTNIDDPAVRRGKPQPQNAFGAQPYHRHLV